MDKEKSKKFSALIRQRRLRIALPVLAILGAIAGVLFFFIVDLEDAKRTLVVGTVDSWSRSQSETGAAAYFVQVTLRDGSKITATANPTGRVPITGEQVEIVKTETSSGRILYRWTRGLPFQAQQ